MLPRGGECDVRYTKKGGQLGPQVGGYRAWLTQRSYTPGAVRNMLKDLGQVGLWLSIRSTPQVRAHRASATITGPISQKGASPRGWEAASTK